MLDQRLGKHALQGGAVANGHCSSGIVESISYAMDPRGAVARCRNAPKHKVQTPQNLALKIAGPPANPTQDKV